MSAKYISSNWRLLNQENSSKSSDNYGLTFDGSEYIDLDTLASEISSNETGSFALWINLNDATPTTNNTPIYVGNKTVDTRLYINCNTDGTCSAILRHSSSTKWILQTTQAVFSDNTWHHIVITQNGTEPNIYIDGAKPAQSFNVTTDKTQWINNLPSINSVRLGHLMLNNSQLQNFNGIISDTAIYDYPLSESQISTLYGSSSLGAGNPMALKPAPVAFYPLGDNSASNPLTQPNEAVEDATVFDFDASDSDIINTSYTLPANTTTFSVSMWVKTTNLSTLQGLIGSQDSSSDGYWVSISSNNINFKINGTTTTASTSSLNANTWFHLVVTYDGSNAKVYLNNGSPVSNSVTETINITANTIIGRLPWAAFYYLTGSISNAQIWDTNLSSSEVETLYNSGVPLLTGTQPQEANLKGWYKLDQSANWDVSGSGNWTIPDASGNGNDGTSSGMTSANLVLSDLTRSLPYDSYSFNFDAASSDYIDCGALSQIGSSSSFTINLWAKSDSSTGFFTLLGIRQSTTDRILVFNAGSANKLWFAIQNGINDYIETTHSLSTTEWEMITLTYDGSLSAGSRASVYINGSSISVTQPNLPTSVSANMGTSSLYIGLQQGTSGYYDGKLSNISLFNETLTSTEVLKLYSNGMPQDLSSFSPAPVAWWTLGSNSFFNGTNYICRDLIGSNDGTSANAGVDAIVGDSPRSSANGTGTNMDVPSNLEGQTKYSSNNSWSINMSETARVEDTP